MGDGIVQEPSCHHEEETTVDDYGYPSGRTVYGAQRERDHRHIKDMR